MTCCCLDDDPPSCECEDPYVDSITIKGFFANRWNQTTYSEQCDQYPGNTLEEQAATLKRVDEVQSQTYLEFDLQMVCTGGTAYATDPSTFPPTETLKRYDRKTFDRPYGFSRIDTNRVCENGQPNGLCYEFDYAYADISADASIATGDDPEDGAAGGRANTRLYVPNSQGQFSLPQWVYDLGIVPDPAFVYRVTEVRPSCSTRQTLNQYDRSYLPACVIFEEYNELFDQVLGINYIMGDSNGQFYNNSPLLLEVSVLPYCDHRLRGSVIWDGAVIQRRQADGYEYVDLPDEIQESETTPGATCGQFGAICGHPSGQGEDCADTEITTTWRCDGKITGWTS